MRQKRIILLPGLVKTAGILLILTLLLLPALTLLTGQARVDAASPADISGTEVPSATIYESETFAAFALRAQVIPAQTIPTQTISVQAMAPAAAKAPLFTQNPATSGTVAPYHSYNYNVWGESVPVPPTYEVERVFDGESTGAGRLKNPGDMDFFKSKLYVLDSGNSRILVFDDKFEFNGEITLEQGEGLPSLENAKGLTVDPQGGFWISTGTTDGLVFVSEEGEIQRVIAGLTGKNTPEGLVYKPLKTVVGSGGTLYSVSEGSFQGIIEMTPEGEFLRFFGSNRVDVTLKVITEFFWKRLFAVFSDAALESMIKIVPIEFSSLAVDAGGFIYAVTPTSLNSMYEIKKLDPRGANVLRVKPEADVFPGVRLNIGDYGDIEESYDEKGKVVDTKFTDISIDDRGFIFALDEQRSKIFQYDQESNLLAVFGGPGLQQGTFVEPVAIETVGDKLLVLDRRKGDISVFTPTEFGRAIMEATGLYNEGHYVEAGEKWEEVLSRSANFDLAYTGLGKAMFNKRDYRASMKYFKLGYDKRGYDEAFVELRKDFLRRNFALLGGLVLILMAGYMLYKRFVPRKSLTAYSVAPESKWLPVKYVTLHPFKAFYDVRDENSGDLKVSLAILLVFNLVRIIRMGLTGFLFSNVRLELINIPRQLLVVNSLYLLWIVSNLAVSTLMDGEGRARDVVIVTSYALIPLIIGDLSVSLLSHVLTLREGAFLSFITVLAVIWAFMMMFVGIMSVHHYSAGKTILCLIFTLVGLIFILFLAALVYSLFRQMMMFFSNVFTEIMFRI